MLGRSRNRFYHRGVQSTVFGNVLDLQFTEFGKLSDTITHSRAGNATMVDSDGLIKWAPHNLLTYSEAFDQWNAASGGLTVVGGQESPQNTFTAYRVTITNSSDSAWNQTLGVGYFEAGKTYTFSLYIKGSSSGEWTLNWFDGAHHRETVSVNTTWGLYSITFTPSSPQSGSNHYIYLIDDRDNLNTITEATIWGAHLYRSDLGGMAPVPAGERSFPSASTYVPTTSSARYLPRVGHHVYNGSAWVNEGVLAESEARTNLFTYSEDFSDSDWDKSNITVDGNTIVAPDGTLTGDKLVTASTSGQIYIRSQSFSSVIGQKYTMSAYFKTAGLQFIQMLLGGAISAEYVNFDVTNKIITAGTYTAASITDVGNGWVFCSFTFESVATITNNNIYPVWLVPSASSARVSNMTGDGTSGVYIWGAQVEAAPTPSSYIPTAGSTVTRAAETFTIPAANLPWPTETYGPELVTNGTFDTDVSGWVTPQAIWDSDGSMLVGDQGGQNYQDITTVIGKKYVASYYYYNESGFRVSFGISFNSGSTVTYYDDTDKPDGTYTTTFIAASTTTRIIFNVRGGVSFANIDNISVRELTRYPVSIQMNGRMTYADNDDANEVIFSLWGSSTTTDRLMSRVATNGTKIGDPFFEQLVSGVFDFVTGADDTYTPGILVPFNIASRHGMTFINGAVDGVALTANTTPTNLPDLSATDLSLAYDYMGTVERFRVWGVDLGDDGIADATAPSLEPSLSLTFDSSESSFVVDDWSA